MPALAEYSPRKTSSELVFDTLYAQITKLEILPGTKVSEAETAKLFGLSRQPVREAFTRLADLNLLLVRPQRATIVRPFSRSVIEQARFVRTAIELEVVRCAARSRDKAVDAQIRSNLKAQAKAVAKSDADGFHDLDYEFHRLLCASAQKTFAFELIAANKAQVDRLCTLSLANGNQMDALVDDHVALVEAIFDGNETEASRILELHLGRLSPTIRDIYDRHSQYFEEEGPF